MAKKKTEAADESAAAAPKKKTTTTRKTTGTAAAAKSAKSTKSAKPAKAAGGAASAPADMPHIDTNLAAQSAAQMLLNRDRLQTPAPAEGQGSGPSPESASFKQLKESLKKPQLTNPLLDPTAGASQKKSGVHNILNRQTGHNQTLGHFNRAGVPRRTPG